MDLAAGKVAAIDKPFLGRKCTDQLLTVPAVPAAGIHSRCNHCKAQQQVRFNSSHSDQLHPHNCPQLVQHHCSAQLFQCLTSGTTCREPVTEATESHCLWCVVPVLFPLLG